MDIGGFGCIANRARDVHHTERKRKTGTFGRRPVMTAFASNFYRTQACDLVLGRCPDLSASDEERRGVFECESGVLRHGDFRLVWEVHILPKQSMLMRL